MAANTGNTVRWAPKLVNYLNYLKMQSATDQTRRNSYCFIVNVNSIREER